MNILLVDDDAELLHTFSAVLRTFEGAHVGIAISGEKALAAAKLMGGVDLLIADIIMEPMDGFAVRDQLQSFYPKLKTIFITGDDSENYIEQVQQCQVLAKPILEKDIIDAVRREAGNRFNAKSKAAETKSATSLDSLYGLESGDGIDFFLGQRLGGFHILQRVGVSRWGNVYEATQMAIGRKVALTVLAPEMQGDFAMMNIFIANARAKANAQHPITLDVFEADEASGYCYYTHEFSDGETLGQMAGRGEKIDSRVALSTLRAVSEALLYFSQHRIAHTQLNARHIFITSNRQPRLANLAIDQTFDQSAEAANNHEEMAALGHAVEKTLARKNGDEKLIALLRQMQASREEQYPSWGALLTEIKNLEPELNPPAVIKLKEGDVAAIHAIEAARHTQRWRLAQRYAAWFLLFWVALLAGCYAIFHRDLGLGSKRFSTMIRIPAGKFIFQNGEEKTLPAFWIDRYEVTIGQYAEFLNYLRAHPDAAKKFDNPAQPPEKSHVPKNWDIYFRAATALSKSARKVRGIPISVDCPVFMVDWWDAYAYAKWKGRELPTEEEWEKAARGANGNLYPWGNQWNASYCDSGEDYARYPTSATKPKADGFLWWAPVDAVAADISPYGVNDMGGNVSEWTSSWDANHRTPIIKGGSFFRNLARDADPAEDCKTTHRILPLTTGPFTTTEYLGFRTVSHLPPQ